MTKEQLRGSLSGFNSTRASRRPVRSICRRTRPRQPVETNAAEGGQIGTVDLHHGQSQRTLLGQLRHQADQAAATLIIEPGPGVGRLMKTAA